MEVGLLGEPKKGHRTVTFNSSVSSEEMEIAVTESFIHIHTHTHTHTQKCERQEFCPIALAPTAAVTFNSNDYISLYATLRNAMPKSHHYGSPFTLRSSESRQF